MRHAILGLIKKELTSLGIECKCTTHNELIECIKTYTRGESVETLDYVGSNIDPLHSVVRTSTYPYTYFSQISEAFSGNFGTLYHTMRTREPDNQKKLFLKVAKRKEDNTLHVEAILHAISNVVLSFYGFSWAIPRIFDIVRHPHFGISFTIERCPEARLLKHYLDEHLEWGVASSRNDTILLGIISQLSTYIAILEHELYMNHRDLTGSNVLMIIPSDSVKKTVAFDKYLWTLQISHKTILVDFGFSCLGSLPSRKTAVNSGNYFPDTDFCPKDGRDMFLFIASLWKNPQIRQSVTPKVTALIHTWLRTTRKNNWAQWIESAQTMDMRSMYLLTMSDSFSSPSSSPIQIIKDIANEFSHIVFFQERSVTPLPRSLYE